MGRRKGVGKLESKSALFRTKRVRHPKASRRAAIVRRGTGSLQITLWGFSARGFLRGKNGTRELRASRSNAGEWMQITDQA